MPRLSFFFDLFKRLLNRIFEFSLNYIEISKWFTVLLPLYFKLFWKKQKEQVTLLFIVYTIIQKFVLVVFTFLKFIWKYTYTSMLHDWVVLFWFVEYLYVTFSVGFFVRIRLYFYLFFYLAIFLFNFYLLWSLFDLWFLFSKNGIICESFGINRMWKILHADFTPYNIFAGGNDLLFAKRFFVKLRIQKWISVYNTPGYYYYERGFIFIYITYYFLLLFIITLAHILFRLKHIFDDYLRDFDKNLVLFYYYLFCFICLYFFFVNLNQIFVSIINIFNFEQIQLLFLVYMFFLVVYSIYLFYTVLISNRFKKILNINIVFYFLVLIIVIFIYYAFSFFFCEKLLELYIYLRSLYLYGIAPQYLLFSDNSVKVPACFFSYIETRNREYYYNHILEHLQKSKLSTRV